MQPITLTPGESREVDGGYIACSWNEMPYYAERLDRDGYPLALSPGFVDYASALAWVKGE
jgi:hypothetical protein